MWKKLLISLALGAVLDLILEFATRMRDEAESEAGRARWEVIIGVILLLKANPNLLTKPKK